MHKYKKRYSGQPENEIWFYDKSMPYYWLTNFYASPIKTKLPVQPLKNERKEKILDEKGRIPAGHEYFYLDEYLNWYDGEKRKNILTVNKFKSKEVEWHTAEHLFQALKLTDWCDQIKGLDKDGKVWTLKGAVPESIFKAMDKENTNDLAFSIKYLIIENPSPAEVRNEINKRFSLTNGLRVDWFKLMDDHAPLSGFGFGYKESKNPMRLRAMRYVAREKFKNSWLKDKLWKTGNKKLVEHSPHDKFWGDGGDGSGQNMLGKILMEIRQEIIAEKGECSEAEIMDESEVLDTKKPESTSEKDAKDKDKKTALIEKNIQEIKNKLKTGKISSEQEIEILGDCWETDYRMSWVTRSEEEIEKAKKGALEEIEEYIIKKTNDKNNRTEKTKEENEQNHRQMARVSVTSLLNQSPPISSHELEDYQGWESHLNTLSNQEEVNIYRDLVLAKIRTLRVQKQTEKEMKDNLNKINNPSTTIEDKKQVLENMKKRETQKDYQQNQADIKKAKQEVAANDITDYQTKLVQELVKKMTNEGIEEKDLDAKIRQKFQAIKNQQITDPQKLIETETVISQKIYQTGARRKITSLASQVTAVCRAKNKQQKQKLCQILIQFIASNNIYYQTHKTQAEQLLNQLQNEFEKIQTSPSSLSSIPWLPTGGIILLIGVLGLVVAVIIKSKAKKSHSKKEK